MIEMVKRGRRKSLCLGRHVVPDEVGIYDDDTGIISIVVVNVDIVVEYSSVRT